MSTENDTPSTGVAAGRVIPSPAAQQVAAFDGSHGAGQHAGVLSPMQPAGLGGGPGSSLGGATSNDRATMPPLSGRAGQRPLPETDLPLETVGPAPGLVERVSHFDGVDTRYRFEVHGLDVRPDRANVVYALASQYRLLFVGAADHLPHSLEHEAPFAAARRLGACFLLVHSPSATDFVPHGEAARRLACHLKPPLNA